MHDALRLIATVATIAAIASVWVVGIWVAARQWRSGRPNHLMPEQDRLLLPPRYRDGGPVSSAPMGAADLVFDDCGQVSWDCIWGDFCDLAWAGGPPHRGTLLQSSTADEVHANRAAYDRVVEELRRGLTMITHWPVRTDVPLGSVGLVCPDVQAAQWLTCAITAENVEAQRAGALVLLPAGPAFRLDGEIKNVITAVANTHHYWAEHRTDVEQRAKPFRKFPLFSK